MTIWLWLGVLSMNNGQCAMNNREGEGREVNG